MTRCAAPIAIATGFLLGVATAVSFGVLAAPLTVTVPPRVQQAPQATRTLPCPDSAPWSAEAAACVDDRPTSSNGRATADNVEGHGRLDNTPRDVEPVPVQDPRSVDVQSEPEGPPVVAPQAPPPVSNSPQTGVDGASTSPPAPTETVVPDPLPMVVRQPDGRRMVRRDGVEAFLRDESSVRQNAPQRTVPHYEDGVLLGYRLEGLGLGSVYTDLGIRDGDTIVRVNGTFIDSPQRGWALYAALQQSESFVVELLRRDRTRVLHFDIVDDETMRQWFASASEVPF